MTEPMPTVTSTMLRRKTNAVLDMAENGPVLITHYGKPAYVLMSADHYKRISAKGDPAL